ncbi:hypothetical protein CB1_002337030 [Camelus ferus]|nr:hypothetical protein CB1_002337030 [Camelus ferus]
MPGFRVLTIGGNQGRVDYSTVPTALLREEVSRLQEEVHLLRQMKEMLMKDLEESQGGKSSEVLSATELRVQLAQKEQELARAKEALQDTLLEEFRAAENVLGLEQQGTPVSFMFPAGVAMPRLPLQV